MSAMRLMLAPALLCCAWAAAAGPKVIYGSDDRVDYYAAAPEWRALADSTVALFWGDKVGPDGSLGLESFARRHNVCKTERFADQLSGSYCTGSLVAPDIVLTAGHCVHMRTDQTDDLNMPECPGIKAVFGYALKSAGAAPAKVDAGEVYRCADVIARIFPGTGSRAGDFALIRLDRPAAGHAPLQPERGAGAAPGDGVTAIGTPSGLPLKIAGNAVVREASDPWYFTANLDTFGGNSGSPVFNSRSRLLEGIIVRGDSDFRSNDGAGCNVYNVKPSGGGRGEDVIKIAAILPYLDAARAAAPRAARGAEVAPVAENHGLGSLLRAVQKAFDGGR